MPGADLFKYMLQRHQFLPMSKFLQNVYGADRANQAVALLGGATAPSYEALSLRRAENLSEADLGVLLSGPNAYIDSDLREADSNASFVGDKFELNGLVSSPRSASLSSLVVDEAAGLEPGSLAQASQDTDLVSRFQTSDSDDSAPVSFLPIDPRAGTDAVGESIVLSNDTSPMPSFLEQLVAKFEAVSGDISADLDGSRQGAVRELIFDVGSELSTLVRTELQDSVAGVGRELAAQAIGRVGIDPLETAVEPLLTVDYYGESAVVINETLGSIGQPIGSIALPQVGPFVASLMGELAALAA